MEEEEEEKITIPLLIRKDGRYANIMEEISSHILGYTYWNDETNEYKMSSEVYILIEVSQ